MVRSPGDLRSADPASGQPPYCAERVNYPVYIPFGGTQADLVASLANLTAAYQILLGVAPQCAIASADVRDPDVAAKGVAVLLSG